ncbi:MAG TPA: tripartite tricarboxylate transporter substrate-binding protein [Burkholderiales bacterium]|nr:tripartite tricarboxylate transporter substrate-binding protein [Burkholderiales bacterium]
MRLAIAVNAITALGLAVAAPGHAQPAAGAQQPASAAFPAKMVRFVIPFAVGGSSDANGRIIAPPLSERWKQQIIIEPRPGAATVLGTDVVAKSPPDGHTLLINSTQFSQSPAMFAKLPFDSLTDLLPITRITRSPQVIVAHPSLPAKNIRELVAFARTRPGQINMANAGTSMPSYLFNMLAKVKIESVPYKGAGPMMIDAMGGHVHLAIGAVSSVQAAVRSGRMRMLGVTSLSLAFPEVPVISKDVPGFDADTWFALFAPRGTPREVVQRIRDDVAAVIQNPETRQRLLDIGGEPSGEQPEEFAARVRAEIARWKEVAVVAGIKSQ